MNKPITKKISAFLLVIAFGWVSCNTLQTVPKAIPNIPKDNMAKIIQDYDLNKGTKPSNEVYILHEDINIVNNNINNLAVFHPKHEASDELNNCTMYDGNICIHKELKQDIGTTWLTTGHHAGMYVYLREVIGILDSLKIEKLFNLVNLEPQKGGYKNMYLLFEAL